MQNNKKIVQALQSFEIFIDNTMDKVQKKFEFEDAYAADIIGKAITTAIQESVKTIKVEKDNELTDKMIKTEINKALDVVSTTTVRNANSKQDILNKAEALKLLTKQALDVVSATKVKDNQAQLLLEQKYMQSATRLRQQGATVDANGNVTLSINGNSIAEKNLVLLTNQALKVVQETAQTTKKTQLMEKQVFHNCLIQGMKQAADYTLAIASGGLIPDDKMHVNFFAQNKGLFAHAGATFAADGTITIPNPNNASETLTLGEFSTDVTVTEAS